MSENSERDPAILSSPSEISELRKVEGKDALKQDNKKKTGYTAFSGSSVVKKWVTLFKRSDN